MRKNPPHLPGRFDVHAQTYSHRVHVLAPDFVFFERDHQITQAHAIQDAFGPSWILGLAHVEANQVAVSRKGGFVHFEGLLAFFMPPYTIVKWHLHPGRLQWIGYMSERPLPPGLPQEAVCFRWTEKSLPVSVEQIHRILSKKRNYVSIEKIEKASALASKAKKAIDRSYMEDLRISEMAQNLRCSRVVMGRAFKEAYGIAPVEYRNHLRIFHSLRLLRQGQDVASAGHDAGFGHISRYNRQFRKHLLTNPREYCLAKKTSKALDVEKIQGGISKWRLSSSPEGPGS